MAKDPAFLFYPNDWLGGNSGMNFEEKGALLELFILQFNKGPFTLEQAKKVLNIQFEKLWPELKEKFTEQNQKFFNERLEFEKSKRAAFTESRRSNLNKKIKTKNDNHMEPHMQPHMEPHMENGNGNENINADENKGGAGENSLKAEIKVKSNSASFKKPETVDDIEVWTQQVIDKNDPAFEIILANESCRGQPVRTDEHLVRSHETKCLREQTEFKNQQHFRKSLLSYLKTATKRLNGTTQTNTAQVQLRPPGTAPRLNETGFGTL